MPVARGASSPLPGSSGRALGWECRVMWCGVAVPASLPPRPHRQHGQVERVEDQLHAPAGPAPGRPGTGSRAGRPVAVLETVRHSDQRNASARSASGGARERAAGFPPGQRRLPGLGMLPDVVDRLGPGGEQLVQLRQVRDPGGAVLGQLDQELAADGPEKSFDFPPSLGPAGLAVDQLDAQLRAGPQQPRIDERRLRYRRRRARGPRGRPARGAARRPAGWCPRRTRTGRPSPLGNDHR